MESEDNGVRVLVMAVAGYTLTDLMANPGIWCNGGDGCNSSRGVRW